MSVKILEAYYIESGKFEESYTRDKTDWDYSSWERYAKAASDSSLDGILDKLLMDDKGIKEIIYIELIDGKTIEISEEEFILRAL